MDKLSIANDIIPVGEFKTNVSKWLKNIKNTGHPLIITQNGKPAGVLLTPEEYDELVYRKSFLDSVSRGIDDMDKGKSYTTEELKKELNL